jgi:hypothetical protein
MRWCVAESSEVIAEELRVFDTKLKQLSFQYEQYFLGSRPREPIQLRSEVQKIVSRYSNVGIQNTSLRFKFNNLCARFFTLRRHWDEVLRKIEQGTYERQIFRANLRERSSGSEEPQGERPAAGSQQDCGEGAGDLFDSYVEARSSCGEDVAGLTRERLDQIVASQTLAIQERYGCEEVRFRVVVEQGRAKLKATPLKRQG